jgi:hypothetical protein
MSDQKLETEEEALQMQKPTDAIYPALVTARIPRELNAALTTVARAKYQKRSAYVRHALLKSLRDDGVVLAPLVSAA